MIIDDDYWKALAGTGFTLEGEAVRYLEVNNLALQDKPDDLVIYTHICRGNYLMGVLPTSCLKYVIFR